MSHGGVEIVLGRLATDESIRRRFREAPAQALRDLLDSGIELSPVERTAPESLDASALQDFARTLDARLQKAVRSLCLDPLKTPWIGSILAANAGGAELCQTTRAAGSSSLVLTRRHWRPDHGLPERFRCLDGRADPRLRE